MSGLFTQISCAIKPNTFFPSGDFFQLNSTGLNLLISTWVVISIILVFILFSDVVMTFVAVTLALTVTSSSNVLVPDILKVPETARSPVTECVPIVPKVPLTTKLLSPSVKSNANEFCVLSDSEFLEKYKI